MQIVEGDLLAQSVDVIVNPWNRNFIPWWLLIPQGVSGAIRRNAGIEPFRELGKYGSLDLGQAIITRPGRLTGIRAIVHVAGLDWFWRASERSIRLSVRNATELTKNSGYQSIALPLIGSGTGGFSEEAAERILVEELQNCCLESLIVRFSSRQRNRPIC